MAGSARHLGWSDPIAELRYIRSIRDRLEAHRR